MPVEVLDDEAGRPLVGPRGQVAVFVRAGGRSPARDFLSKECQKPMRKKFHGTFGALVRMGADLVNDERFKPLKGPGKPLWEFKEHDHRLYCARNQTGQNVDVVLLAGWIKDKKGKARQEAREVERAISLYVEYVREAGNHENGPR